MSVSADNPCLYFTVGGVCLIQLFLMQLKSTSVDCTPTSLQLQYMTVFVGTIMNEIFTIDLETFDVKLHVTCHRHAVHDVAFPQ